MPGYRARVTVAGEMSRSQQNPNGQSYPVRRRISHGRAVFDIEVNDRGENEFWTKLESGVWEPDTLAILEDHLDSATLFLDIGGWIGPTTLYAGALGAAVIVVEADPKALPALRRNIELNPKMARRIEIIAKALYPGKGRNGEKVKFGSRRKGGDSMSSLIHEHMATAWQVETISPGRLAELCRGGGKVFMKIDIEGGEYTIFPKAQALFSLNLAAVHLSLHPEFVLGDARGPKRWWRWLGLARDTAEIFRHLGHAQVYRATKTGLIRAPMLQGLARFGLVFWPLKKSWLFLLPEGG